MMLREVWRCTVYKGLSIKQSLWYCVWTYTSLKSKDGERYKERKKQKRETKAEQKVRDSLRCGWLCHLAHPRGQSKAPWEITETRMHWFIQDDVRARSCVFVRRPLYCNKENSLADICLETKDKSGSVYRCFNLSLCLALFFCLLPCN